MEAAEPKTVNQTIKPNRIERLALVIRLATVDA
jgi:hypothetical protein